MGTAGLARDLVNGYKRVPAPQPRITAATDLALETATDALVSFGAATSHRTTPDAVEEAPLRLRVARTSRVRQSVKMSFLSIHTTSVVARPRSRPARANARSYDRSSVVRSLLTIAFTNTNTDRINQIRINQNASRSDRSSPAYLSLVLDRVNAFRRPSRRVTARAEIIVVDVDVIVIIVASH